MTNTPNLLLIVGVSSAVVGCAAVDSGVKVPPGNYDTHRLFDPAYITPTNSVWITNSSYATNAEYGEKLNWVMPLVEVDDSRFIHPISEGADKHGKDKPPLFLAYDTSRIEQGQFDVLFPNDDTTNAGAATARARNELVGRIIYRSNCNFDTYASRLRTFDRGNSLAQDTLDLISTATIGGTALLSPPVAAGLAAGKTVAIGTTQNIQKDLFSGQTVDVMLKAMAANRDEIITTIDGKLYTTNAPAASPYGSYTMYDVLEDVRTLNEASSVYGTLEAIAGSSSAKSQTAKALAAQIKTSRTGMAPDDVHKKVNDSGQ
jgi:hypothetical protein